MVEKINRIDARYYLIRINKNFYVVDYSDPKDFRNWFFVTLFPKNLREFDAYDVTGDEEQFIVDNLWKYQKIFGKFFAFFFFVNFFTGFFLPPPYNPFYLTYDTFILKNWFYFLLLIILGAVLIIVLLNLFSLKNINLDRYNKYTLTEIRDDQPINFKKMLVLGVANIVVLYPILLFFAFYWSNYMMLILFGFIAPYSLCFIKFIEFRPSMRKLKYYIKEINKGEEMKYLPAGSVIYLSSGDQEIVILNRGPTFEQNGKEVYFDYTGVKFPDGLNAEMVYYFNHEDIDTIIFKGYVNEKEIEYEKRYKQWTEENNLSKGVTKIDQNT